MTSTDIDLQGKAPMASWERTLHVFALCAFAFSEPLFSALTQQFVYLHDIQAGWTEIAVVTLALTVVLPTFFVLLDRFIVHMAARWRGFGRDGVMVLLSFLVSLSLLRPFVRVQFLAVNACVWVATLAIAIPLSILFAYAYRRSSWMRCWISVTAVGLVCFPGMFVYQFGTLRQNDLRQTSGGDLSRIPAKNPVPVIIVIFDEFSGTTLMNRDLELDKDHFPQFARLGELSTWYRNASTVHCRTDVAVPAILSGRFPTVKRPPLEAEYPGNLLQVIHRAGTFEMVVCEPITRLCPTDLKPREQHPRTFLWKITSMAKTLSAVYPRLILPDDTPLDFPPISRIWFGLPENLMDDRSLRNGLIRHHPFDRRDAQLQQFIDCLRPSDQPLFAFLHIELPHMPWFFLPSGRYHNFEFGTEFHPPGARGDLGEDWDADPAVIARNEHRYLQQVRFVDRFIGQLLDYLQKKKLIEQSLLIVTADHGVSFRPNHSRRIPDTETLPDILSVPLFIKLPGQKTGKISDENAESVDILPTIADVLDLTLPEIVDGSSLVNDKRRPRKSLYIDQKLMVIEAEIPRLKSAVERRLAIFDGDSWDHPPRISASHPEWHGRSIGEFAIEERPLAGAMIDQPVKPVDAAGNSEFVACLVRGSIEARALQMSTVDLVVAVNGIICDSGIPYRRNLARQEFEFVIPEEIATAPLDNIDLFLVDSSADAMLRLRRIAKSERFQIPVALP